MLIHYLKNKVFGYEENGIMIKEICRQIEDRIQKQHIKDMDGIQLFMISAQYPGLWLEHVYDSVIYAKMDKSKLYLARNAIDAFVDNQRGGQYPFRVIKKDGKVVFEYTQIQECVSFVTLALEVAEMINDEEYYKKIYNSGKNWIEWLENNRMTMKKGLIEMFMGYDTGHDGSGRFEGMMYKLNNYLPDGSIADAAVLPEKCDVAPILAVDMNCNFYGDITAVAKLAEKLGYEEEARAWTDKAQKVKEKLFEICYDKEDAFFYDVDKHGNKRKYLSSTIFHLFLEKVLDKEKDKEIINEIYKRHIKNKNEFWTKYPFPSMAICDKSCENHDLSNCWGYYTQGLIILRCIRWMDYYGFSDDFDYICNQWQKSWTNCFDYFKLGQELDPITGKPTNSSEWYSSCMLMYLYIAKRFGEI